MKVTVAINECTNTGELVSLIDELLAGAPYKGLPKGLSWDELAFGLGFGEWDDMVDEAYAVALRCSLEQAVIAWGQLA